MTTMLEARAARSPGRVHRVIVAISVTAIVGLTLVVLWTASFPGPPGLEVLIILALVLTLTVLLPIAAFSRPLGQSSGRAAVLVALVSAFTLLVPALATAAPLRLRFEASRSDFEATIAAYENRGQARPLVKMGSGYFPFPIDCPSSIGSFRIADCRVLDGAVYFMQAPGAVTDDSAIIYNPSDTTSTRSSGFVPLGDGWFSWTCHC